MPGLSLRVGLTWAITTRPERPSMAPTLGWLTRCCLLGRMCSRLAGRRVVFQPYSKDQLVTIVRSRLGAALGAGQWEVRWDGCHSMQRA